MSRIPNFKIDNEVFGKKGEVLCEKYMPSKCLLYLDVREAPEFQDKDIDYVMVFNKDYDNLSKILSESFTKQKNARMKNWATVEVKTDTRTHNTRNLVYEVLSYDNPGCLARSLADFIFYVAINNDATEIHEAWMINLQKWRTWIRETSPRLNSEDATNVPLRLNNYNKHGEACLNFLCNVDTLVKKGIAVELNVKKYL